MNNAPKNCVFDANMSGSEGEAQEIQGLKKQKEPLAPFV